MPRARTKAELIEFGQREYAGLLEVVADLSPEQATRTPVFENRTVKDILAHLYAWHAMFLRWYAEGMAGEKPAIPAEGYSFKDTPALNEDLYQAYKDWPWGKVLKSLQAGHSECMAIIETHSDEELTTKKKYAWTGSTNLASYLASATSSHYVWGRDLIRKFKKGLNGA